MSFSSANALSTLLTTESLLFAVFALSLNIGSSPDARTMISGVGAARCAAALLTVLATGALVAWGDVFLCHWPHRFGQWFPAAAMAGGIVAQPIFAWVFVAKVTRPPRRSAIDSV